ncbi:MAG TPA: tetratricopeptide repeat protein [Bryobacteraceae bacterium]|nr:tetratricopeptide repeat protein [Bryobacteraceae bacterium]
MKALALTFLTFTIAAAASDDTDLMKARDHQDRAALDKLASESRNLADKQPNDAAANYRLALAESYSAEVAIEMHDKNAAKNAAQAGMDAANKAVTMKPDSAEYQRLLGTLCGQMVSSNSLAGLRYGKCALDSVDKAIQLDPKSSMAYLSHGVGNYYLPQAFGGGVDLAIKDFRKAIELNPKNADAWLWLGVALRKSNQPAEAQKAFEKSLEINPNRVWAKQQLDKTSGS